MASPFQPLKAQATTGRPVKGLTQMPALGGASSPMQTIPSKGASGPKPSMNGSGQGKSFAQPTPNKAQGSYTHEQRGGSAPVGMTPGITGHNSVPHIGMHP
jgi:hypothetical protein